MAGIFAPDRRELSSEARLREPGDPGYHSQELIDRGSLSLIPSIKSFIKYCNWSPGSFRLFCLRQKIHLPPGGRETLCDTC